MRKKKKKKTVNLYFAVVTSGKISNCKRYDRFNDLTDDVTTKIKINRFFVVPTLIILRKYLREFYV